MLRMALLLTLLFAPGQILAADYVWPTYQRPRVQLYFFTASWCGVCKPTIKEIEAMARISNWIVRKPTDPDWELAHIVIVDIEKHPDIAKGITSVPYYARFETGKATKYFNGRADRWGLAKIYKGS